MQKYLTTPEGRITHRDRMRRYQWKAAGIDMTDERYDAMLANQGGVCAICGRVDSKKRLSVDHDHKTGFVRGLLCWRCNRFIVTRHRDGWLLRRAADYLDKAADLQPVELVPS